MNSNRPAYTFWQIAVILILALLSARMALDAEQFCRNAEARAAAVQPILDLMRDMHADISKSTTCMTHEKIIFELHGINRRISRYYGDQKCLVRETDSGLTKYALDGGAIQLGMDHGMILSRVYWLGRVYLYGAPPGWAVSREELIAQ